MLNWNTINCRENGKKLPENAAILHAFIPSERNKETF